MEYMSAREAANKWGISQRRVAILCSEQRIARSNYGREYVANPYNSRKTDRCKKYSI